MLTDINRGLAGLNGKYHGGSNHCGLKPIFSGIGLICRIILADFVYRIAKHVLVWINNGYASVISLIQGLVIVKLGSNLNATYQRDDDSPDYALIIHFLNLRVLNILFR